MKRLLPLLFISATFISQSVFAGGGAPANDLCASAEPIACGQTLSGSTTSATADGTLPFCGTSLTTGPGVWYTFYGDGADVTVTTCGAGTDYDTKLGVFSGTCGALVCEGGDDDDFGCGFDFLQSTVTVSTVCGQQYFVYVTGFGSGSGNYDLTMTCAGLGNGDPFVIAQDLTVVLDATGNYSFTSPLTPQTNASVSGSTTSPVNTVRWQSFTPTVDGILDNVGVTFASLSGGNTLTFNVYTGQGNGGGLLYTEPMPLPSIGVLTTIDIDATIDLTSGTEYTFEIIDATGSFGLRAVSPDPYPGGISNINATTDLSFNVDILQRPEVDNGTTDSDGISHWELDVTSFNCSNTATPVPVTLTAYDKLGNSSACIANVTVEDNIDPIAICVPSTVLTPVTNTYSDAPALPIPDGDPIGTTTNIIVPESIDITDVNVSLNVEHTWVGDIIVTLESPNGDVATLVDQIGEPAIGSFGCSENDFNVVLDDAAGSALEDECTSPITGTFTATDLLSIFNSTDAAGTWILTISDNANADIGTLLDWSLEISGNQSSVPTVLSLDANGDHVVDELAIDDGSSDACGFTLTTSPASFNCGDVGVQSITLTATDPSGNSASCVTQVEVVDDMLPVMDCQNITVQLDGTGAASIVPGDIAGATDDNCGISSLSASQLDFNCSDLGPNNVTLYAEDINGNIDSCVAVVTVEDNQDPVIVCPSDIVVCAEYGVNGATVDYVSPTGSDNCGFTITQTDASGLTDGDFFPLGSTTQEWTITDQAGNVVTCTFTVTVNDSPEAAFSNTPACQGEAIFFTDQSTIEAGYSIASWEWDMGDGSSTIGLVDPIHSYADTGLYTVELVVTSANGCSDTTETVLHVTPVPSSSFTYVAACEGNPTVFTNTSTIDAGTLTYEWDFGDGGTSVDVSPSYSYAVDGTYTVTLTATSADGCVDVSTQSITVNDSPTALFSANTVCEGTATDFTNLSTGGGSPSYAWDFGDSNTSSDVNPSHTYATFGTYTVSLTVTNTNGCEDVHTASVTVNGLPNVDFTFSNVCEGTPANFVNGSDPGSSNWSLGDGSSSTLTNVSHVYADSGLYDVTLTVTDGNFCINSLTQQIQIYDLPDFTLTPTDVLCYGEATGVIEVVPAATPAAPWNLSLNGGTPQSVSVFFNDLEAGNYDVLVEDANGCEFTVSTVIDQPDDTLGIVLNTVSDNLCHGDDSGVIDVSGEGGTAGYMYQINGGGLQASGAFTGLSAGDHDVQIVDANACVFDTTITLTEPDTLVLTLVEANDLLCNGDNSGSLTVAGTGGVLDYEYNLDGGTYDVSPTFTGLAAGTYVVGVLDANGCTDTLHVTLTEPGILTLSLIDSEDALCNAEASGYIQVEASSGTPDYQYSLDGVNFQGGGLFEGLLAGDYTVTVMDANGCLDEIMVTLDEPTPLVIETNSVPVACFGDETGQILITASGGTTDYMYSIDGGANFDPSGSFSGLSNGNYLAVVEDENGCSASEGVIISQPSSVFILTANITNVGCLNDSTGSVVLIGTGGTPTYTYSDDNYAYITPNTFGGYADGTYIFYGMDLNGCLDSVEVDITEPATAVEITNTLISNPACPNEPSGSVTVQVTGGTPGYMYSSNGGNTYQSDAILTGIGGGGHLIAVMDENGCVDTAIVTLVSPPLLSVDADTIVGVECEGDLDGEIHVVASGGSPSYTYSLNGGSLQTDGEFVNLGYGDYAITITDVNGCEHTDDFSVPAGQLLPVAAFDFNIIGTAVAFINQSLNADTYSWDFHDGNSSTEVSPTHFYENDGDYWVTLTATNDCGTSTATEFVSTTNVGVNEAEDISFNLYPNPANEAIFLQPNTTVDEEFSLEIISVDGKLVRTIANQKMNETGSIRIDLNGISQGVYSLRILSDDYQSVLRFDVIK